MSSDDLSRRVRERNEFFHDLAAKLEMDYSQLRDVYLNSIAFHRMVDLYMLEQPAWTVTFRAKLEAERIPTYPDAGVGLGLAVVPAADFSLLKVHLREQYDPKRPLEPELRRLLAELQAPTGAINYVTVSLRPEES